MDSKVVAFTSPYARGVAAVTEKILDEVRTSIALRTGGTGWIEFAGAPQNAAFLRGLEESLRTKLDYPHLWIFMRRMVPRPDVVQVWVSATEADDAYVRMMFDDMPSKVF